MKRVLVVDDEPVIRALVAASLEGSDCEVATASDGAAALESLQSSHPDLILLDVSLPGLNGPEVLRLLRADQSLAAVPVVFLTGAEPPEDIAPDGVLRKPFTPALLRESVFGWLS
jgi:CheY-like chemotaxis protein